MKVFTKLLILFLFTFQYSCKAKPSFTDEELTKLTNLPGYFSIANPYQIRELINGRNLANISYQKDSLQITPLMRAAKESSFSEVINILVEAGCDVNAISKSNKDEFSVLHFAVKNSNPEILHTLLSHNPDVNAFRNNPTIDSPLELAASLPRKKEQFILLLNSGALPDDGDIHRDGIWSKIIEVNMRNDTQIRLKNTPEDAVKMTAALLKVSPTPDHYFLREALYAGQSQVAILLINAGLNPKYTSSAGTSILIDALSRPSPSKTPKPLPDPTPELIQILVENNAVDESSGHTYTPIGEACKAGMGMEIIKILVKAGAKLNVDNNKLLNLALNSSRDNPELIQYLLDLGFNPSWGEDGIPLKMASQDPYSKPLSAKVLIENGADPFVLVNKSGIFDESGKLLMEVSLKNNSEKLMSDLTKKIMDAARKNPHDALYDPYFYYFASPSQVKEIVNSCYVLPERKTKHIVRQPSWCDAKGPSASLGAVMSLFSSKERTYYEREPPLIHAAEHSPHPEVIDILVKAGCDVRSLKSGALISAIHNKNPDVLQAVLRYKPDLETPLYPNNPNNKPLHYLAWGAETDEHLRIFLEAKPNLNPKDSHDYLTPLMLAIKHNKTERARMLISAGADVEYQNRVRERALDLAIKHGEHSLAKEFIKKGINCNYSNYYGSPLENAVLRDCDPELLKILLDIFGRTGNEAKRALKQAALWNNPKTLEYLLTNGVPLTKESIIFNLLTKKSRFDYGEVVDILLKHGENPNGSINGTTFLCLACERNLPKVVESLLKWGAKPDIKNKQGDTPLILAVSGAYVNSLESDYRNTKSIDCRMSHKIWCGY